MRRREFMTLLGSAAAGWPLAARAQQPERVRRIGVLIPAAADDPEFQARVGAFLQALGLLGWTIGRNVRIDTRWAGANAADIRRHAAELAALAPDVILAHGTSTVGPLLQVTRTVPVVFRLPSIRLAPDLSRAWRGRRQRHRFPLVRIQPEREMAGVAQADRAGRDASGGSSGSRYRLRDRPVRRHPAVAPSLRRGSEPGQRARRRRDRARRPTFARASNGGLIVTASGSAEFIAI